MNGYPRTWLDRLLELAVTLVAIALLLTWAWQLLRPLVPVIAIGGGVATTVRWLWLRRQQW